MSRLPDYKLRGLNKSTDEKGDVGGAWINDDGSIYVKLDPFITLRASPDLVLTLFKYNPGGKRDKYARDKPSESEPKPEPPLGGRVPVSSVDDDDIPF